MKAQAYILISVGVGRARSVYQELHKIKAVGEVNAVSGPYDIIARVDAFDVSTIGTLVLDTIQAIEGVTDTITCHVVSMEN